MTLLDCEFDPVDPFHSFTRLKQLAESDFCAHVASMPAQNRDEFSVVAYACPSCWFAENMPGKDCGLRASRQLKVLATHRKECGRRIPQKVVFHCEIVSDEPDCLTFQGKSSERVPPVVLTPFSTKGKSGSHRVEHKQVDYEVVAGNYLKYASTEWHFEIDRNGVRKSPRLCQLRVAIPPEDDESNPDTNLFEVPGDPLHGVGDDELEQQLVTRLEELSRHGFVIPMDLQQFAKRKKNGKALELQLIRYCFVTNGDLLNRLHRCRQENRQPLDELAQSRSEVFSARAIGKHFGVTHNTVRSSQVYRYVNDQIMPELKEKSARDSRADFEIASEVAAIDSYRERTVASNDESKRQSLIRDIKGSDRLNEDVRDALLTMIEEGWDLEIVTQKLRDFLED